MDSSKTTYNLKGCAILGASGARIIVLAAIFFGKKSIIGA